MEFPYVFISNVLRTSVWRNFTVMLFVYLRSKYWCSASTIGLPNVMCSRSQGYAGEQVNIE